NEQTDKIVKNVLSSNKVVGFLENERINLMLEQNKIINQNNQLINNLNNKNDILSNNLKVSETQLKQTKSELKDSENSLTLMNEAMSSIESNEKIMEKMKHQLDTIETSVIEMKYYDNVDRSYGQRLTSKFPSLYILLRNNKGIKNNLINIKGYRAIKKNNLFDIGYYLKKNPDLRATGKDPFLHYLYHGYKENRKPNPTFDTEYYIKSNLDVQKLDINPLVHYSLYGMKEGRKTYDPSDENNLFIPKIPDNKRKRLEEKYGISVIMPTYNRLYIIKRAIDSVLKQTYTNFELIIIDDGSTDDTEKMIKKDYEASINNGKIKYFKQEKSGVNPARNNALSRATGNIIAYLDSDNYWLETYLENMVAALNDNNCNTAYAAMDVDDKVRNRKFIRQVKYNRNQLLKSNFLDLNVFVHKKILYDQLGGFDTTLKRLVDWDLILRYTRLNEPYYVDHVLAKYFLSHELNNISNTVQLEENISKVYKIHSDERIENGIENLHIGYVLWDFPAFSQTFVMNELKWLVDNNYDVKVFYKMRPDHVAELDFDIDAIKIKNADDLVKKISENNINMMHTHFTYPACTLLTYPAAQKTGTPFTLSAHAVDIFHKKNDKRNKIGEIGRSEYCKKIFVPGKFHQDYLIERGVPNEKLISLRQATKYEIFNDFTVKSPRFERKIKSVITIARFIEKKGIDTLIESAKILDQEDIVFKLFGYGPLEKDLRDQVKKLKLKNVVFEGLLNGNEALKNAYEEGDIFVLPCRRSSDGDMDGVPTVIFEAMAYGIPVITTNVSSIPEFVLNDYYGFIVDSNDPSALAETILKVKNMETNELFTILNRAQNRVKEISSIEETTKTMLDFWKNYRIDIFMVTYQKDEYKDLKTVKEILDRIFKYTTINFDLTIVDNNSDEEFTNFIKDYTISHPNIRLILLNKNLLCGPASNIALEHMNHEFAIYICSNEGFILKHGWEYKALNFMREHENVGMAGTLAYSPDFYNGKTYRSQKFFENFRNKEYIEEKDDVKFKHIQGGIFILRREAYNQSGGFNPLLPQSYMDIEYSYNLKSNNWDLEEIPEWISLTKKTLPNVNTYLDENTSAAHPLSLEELDQLENKIISNCNICNGKIVDNICSVCGSDSSERAIYRVVGKTDKTYRSLKCTLLLKNNTLHKPFKKMFDLNNKKYSTKNIDQDISDSLDNLEKTDIIISNLKFEDNPEQTIQKLINNLNQDGLLILELSNDLQLNNSIKKLLKSNEFNFESVEFVTKKLTNNEILMAERY
ncbi:glycosyltransferase, partial [Methanobacterium sp.]|uniref:glycosyltransferase n=1 Tax=Methanobacterium sp. TaxID=2164 RepID=UPI003C72A6C3